jgi:hypothetical protein
MDFTNPVHLQPVTRRSGAVAGLFVSARRGRYGGRDHVAFGGVVVDQAGAEEVAA